MPNHVRLKRKLARILDREGILNKPVYKEENGEKVLDYNTIFTIERRENVTLSILRFSFNN